MEFTSERQPGQEPVALPPIEFTLDGEKFAAMTEVTGSALLEWSELGLAAAEEVDIDSPEGVAYLARFLRASFTPEEYQRFRRHVRTHHTPPDVVTAIVSELQRAMAESVEAATDRPTVPPSPSSAGGADPERVPARVVSLSKGLVEWRAPTEAERAMGEEAIQPKAKPRGKVKAASGGGG